MTDYENVLVEIDGPVATITLNRPEKLNAISGGLRDDLEAALRELNPDWPPSREGAEDLLDLLDQREDLFEVEEEADDDDNVIQHWVRLAEPENL